MSNTHSRKNNFELFERKHKGRNFKLVPPTEKQISKAYEKLSRFSNYADFVRAVKNGESEKISITDLNAILYYFEAKNSKKSEIIDYYGNSNFAELGFLEEKFSNGTDFFQLYEELSILENYAEGIDNKELLPIKGIDTPLKNRLAKLEITRVSALILRGKNPTLRTALAKQLNASRKSTESRVSAKAVDSWVRQADLWRITGMTADVAFLTVQAGVRHIGDFSKLDIEKIYPIIQSSANILDGFSLVSKDLFIQMIEDAKLLYQLERYQNTITPDDRNLEPSHLFVLSPLDSKINEHTSGQVVRDAMDAVKDILPVLPLPRVISGRVFIRKAEEKDNMYQPFSNMKIAIDGIILPSGHKKDKKENMPQSYTDAEGKFFITMPERYSLQEVITLIISDEYNTQKYMMNAKNLIDAVPEQKLLELILDYKKTYASLYGEKLASLEKPINTIKKKLSETDLKALGEARRKIEEETAHLIEEAKSNTELADIRREIKALDKTMRYIDVDFEKDASLNATIAQINSNMTLYADLGEYKVIEEVFRGLKIDQRRALPSVKLMGENDTATHLESDTMPARNFNYTLLQRLIEPKISNYKISINGTNTEFNIRSALTNPIDVSAFKQNFSTDPESLPKMATLGMGYVVNMSQDWVPDGFSLGTLLYSLILAPGEEQRLIVREKHQGYTVQDTGEAQDFVTEDYSFSQEDDVTTTMNFAAQQASHANASMQAKSNTSSAGGSFGGAGILDAFAMMFGLSGATASSSSSASSNASQINSYSDTSAATNSFNASIQSASQRLAAAKRMSVSSATSSESDSVATKIIANHNHSHTLTIQYWEVMRRYNLETAISSVDLVVFVPLNPINFAKTTTEIERFHLSEINENNERVKNFSTDKYIASKNANTNSSSSSFLDDSQLQSKQTVSYFINDKHIRQAYKVLLDNYDAIYSAAPIHYKQGIRLLKYFSTFSNWVEEKAIQNHRAMTLSFKASIFEFESLDVIIKYRDGAQSKTLLASPAQNEKRRLELLSIAASRDEVLQLIAIIRENYTAMRAGFIDNKDAVEQAYDEASFWDRLFENPEKLLPKMLSGSSDIALPEDTQLKIPTLIIEKNRGFFGIINNTPQMIEDQKYSFVLPSNVSVQDIYSIEIKRNCSAFSVKLFEEYRYNTDYYDSTKDAWFHDMAELTFHQRTQDDNNTANDILRRQYYLDRLPESYHKPTAYFPANELYNYEVKIADVKIEGNNAHQVTLNIPSANIARNMNIGVSHSYKLLSVEDAQKMRESYEHVIENSLEYSKVIWKNLTADERIMMLEPFTITMNNGRTNSDNKEDYTYGQITSNVPLLNCINVHNPIGFYGNCMLFPFTCPKELADEIGKTSAQIQDELYRYHVNAFRSPTSTVTLPTSGMVAEAVLSETNVSEKIDITRFWNWQDSPIDKMPLDKDYLNNADYLSGKVTKDITSLGLQSASAPTAMTVTNLIEALSAKQAPEFKDITGLEQLAGAMNESTKASSNAQTEALKTSSDLAQKAMDYHVSKLDLDKAKTDLDKAKTELEKAKIDLKKLQEGKKTNNTETKKPETPSTN